MLTPKNVIYGFCNTTNPPKRKYLISLYRDGNLHVVACFTTSQTRAGVPAEKVKHGAIRNSDKELVSYVFQPDKIVGVTPDGKDFRFPKQTVIRFDYCFKEEDQDRLLANFESPVIKCKLTDKEYIDLLYAMYHSEDTPEKYKPLFEKVLKEMSA